MRESLLMIPGTLCDALLFQHQLEGLADLANCKVVSNSGADTLEEVAANIIREEEQEQFSVLGLSYGGIIAFEIWRQAPEKINKLILMNTNHRKPSEQTRANQQRFLGMSALGEFTEITTDFLKDAMLHPKNAKNKVLRETVLQMAINTGKEAFFRQIKAQLNRPDSRPDLPNIECPTLVITGRQDQVCTPAIHEEIARLMPNAQLEIVEECGHLSTLEQPLQVNQIIRNWWLEQV